MLLKELENRKRPANGMFIKIVVGTLATGLVATGGGLIKIYRDVGVLQSATSIALEKRVEQNEILLREIGTDRDKRTIIIQQFRDDISELKRRIDNLERRR